jgi:hypothetical protein
MTSRVAITVLHLIPFVLFILKIIEHMVAIPTRLAGIYQTLDLKVTPVDIIGLGVIDRLDDLSLWVAIAAALAAYKIYLAADVLRTVSFQPSSKALWATVIPPLAIIAYVVAIWQMEGTFQRAFTGTWKGVSIVINVVQFVEGVVHCIAIWLLASFIVEAAQLIRIIRELASASQDANGQICKAATYLVEAFLRPLFAGGFFYATIVLLNAIGIARITSLTPPIRATGQLAIYSLPFLILYYASQGYWRDVLTIELTDFPKGTSILCTRKAVKTPAASPDGTILTCSAR